MFLKYSLRLLREIDLKSLLRFVYYFGFKSSNAIRLYRKRIKKGIYFPPFLFISVTNKCNLSCQGCWVSVNQPSQQIAPEKLDAIISQSKKAGAGLFGILGGEPLLYKELIPILAKHRDCYFLLFTNGTTLTDEVAKTLKKACNITPLISIEGDFTESDTRRGGNAVFERTLEGVKNCVKNKLITGVATSICKTNIDDIATESYIDETIKLGIHYVWYYIYRPVGANPQPELALDKQQIINLRKFMVDIRPRKPVLIVDSYWNEKGQAFCPAASGLSHHISPWGDLEPCPPLQFAKDNVNKNDDIFQLFTQSDFLEKFRNFASDRGNGCVLLEDPAALKAFVEKENAYDSSGRNSGISELEKMTILPGHNNPEDEIPDKHWFYRMSKKMWFFGLGAYG